MLHSVAFGPLIDDSAGSSYLPLRGMPIPRTVARAGQMLARAAMSAGNSRVSAGWLMVRSLLLFARSTRCDCNGDRRKYPAHSRKLSADRDVSGRQWRDCRGL